MKEHKFFLVEVANVYASRKVLASQAAVNKYAVAKEESYPLHARKKDMPFEYKVTPIMLEVPDDFEDFGDEIHSKDFKSVEHYLAIAWGYCEARYALLKVMLIMRGARINIETVVKELSDNAVKKRKNDRERQAIAQARNEARKVLTHDEDMIVIEHFGDGLD